MDIPTLNIESRKATGSRAAARLRRDGKLPAVVYGHGRDPAAVALNYHDVEMHLERGHRIVKLGMDGKVQPCQFKAVQYDHLGSSMMHVDLIRVDLTERVKVTVQLDFRGTPKGAEAGGVFRHEMTELEIECVVTEIPESIRVDISQLNLDEVVNAKDVVLLGDATLAGDPEAVIGAVRVPAVAAEAEPTEGEEGAATAEPEVIAKGKPESEAGAASS